LKDEVGIAVECSLIEPQPAHRPDPISTAKTPIADAVPNKTRPSHFHDIKADRFRIADIRKFARSLNTSAFVVTNPHPDLNF
jgi:hypothetical protein